MTPARAGTTLSYSSLYVDVSDDPRSRGDDLVTAARVASVPG